VLPFTYRISIIHVIVCSCFCSAIHADTVPSHPDIAISLDAASIPAEYHVADGSGGFEHLGRLIEGQLPLKDQVLYFCVDRLAYGLPATEVRAEAIAPAGAHGVIFGLDLGSLGSSPTVFRRAADLQLNPGFFGDAIDGLQVTHGTNLIRVNQPYSYLTYWRGSTMLGQPATFSGGGADPDGLTTDDIVLGLSTLLFASGVHHFGLQPGDAIDGLMLFDVTPDPDAPGGFRRDRNGILDPGFDMAIFSLDPFSPSTTTGGGGPWLPGDLILTWFLNDGELFMPATRLGLGPTDNVTAISITPEPASFSLLLAGAAAILSRRRSARNRRPCAGLSPAAARTAMRANRRASAFACVLPACLCLALVGPALANPPTGVQGYCGKAPVAAGSAGFLDFEILPGGFARYSLSATHPSPGLNLQGVSGSIQFPSQIVPAVFTAGDPARLVLEHQLAVDGHMLAVRVDATLNSAGPVHAVVDVRLDAGLPVRYLLKRRFDCPVTASLGLSDSSVCFPEASQPLRFCGGQSRDLFLCLRADDLPAGTAIQWNITGGDGDYSIDPNQGTAIMDVGGVRIPIEVTNTRFHDPNEPKVLKVGLKAFVPEMCCHLDDPQASSLQISTESIRCSVSNQTFIANQTRPVVVSIQNPCPQALDGTWTLTGATGLYNTPFSENFSIPGGGTLTRIVNVTNIGGHLAPAPLTLTVTPQPAGQAGDCTAAGLMAYRNARLTGRVLRVNDFGIVQGPLSGATIQVGNAAQTTTDAQGRFTVDFLKPNDYLVSASKAGFCTRTRMVTVSAGAVKYEAFHLRPETNAVTPTIYNVRVPNGMYLIGGYPGSWSFAATVAWNGSPGSVSFVVNGQSYAATLVDLGCNEADASVTVPVPPTISSCSRLSIVATNGESRQRTAVQNLYFNPTHGIIQTWFPVLNWVVVPGPNTVLRLAMGLFREWELASALGPKFKVEFTGLLGLDFQSLAGVFVGNAKARGKFGLEWDPPGVPVEVIANSSIALDGSLKVTLNGCGGPTLKPSWKASFSGDAGLRMPVVVIIPAVFPPAAGPVNFLLNTPGLGKLMKAFKVGLFVLGGLELQGNYPGGQWGNCFLGSHSLVVNGTVGVKAVASMKLGPAKASVTVGGSGSPAFEICPDVAFQCLTLRAWVELEAKALFFVTTRELSASTRFGPHCGNLLLDGGSLDQQNQEPEWQPIGASMLRWGEPNQLSLASVPRHGSSGSTIARGGSIEERVVENVEELAAPSVIADGSRIHVVFSLHDPSKPWYQATDIASLRFEGSGPWTLTRIADDDAGDLEPRIAAVDAQQDLSCWQQVSGDISGAQGPADVFAHLEIAAARFDRDNAQWSVPALLTANSVLDRDPRPIVSGTQQSVVWVQNAADAFPGDALNGDRLMVSQWTGSSWNSPQTLWADAKGIMDVATTAAAGEAHVLFSVDEDGDPGTEADRELYYVRTIGGTWQAAVRLTNDVIEDALPVLIDAAGDLLAVWSAGETVTWSPLSAWNPQPLFAEHTIANVAPTLEGIGLPGGAAIAYSTQGPSGTDIVAAFYDSTLNVWSLPRRLTVDDQVEDSLSMAYADGKLILAYLKTEILYKDMDIDIDGEPFHLEDVPSLGRTDLCVLIHEQGHDLAVGELEVDPADPAPDSPATIRARVENRGERAALGVQVGFYDSDPNSGGSLIALETLSGTMIAGSSRLVEVSWTVPADDAVHDVFVVVDPALSIDDRDRSNNTASTATVRPDIVVDAVSSEPASPDSVILLAALANDGASTSGPCRLTWRLDSPEGPVLAVVDVDDMVPGAVHELAVVWETSGYTPGEFVEIYAVVDDTHAVSESDEDNNTAVLTVLIPGGDCNANGIPDADDIANFTSQDCNGNQIPDECDIASLVSQDCNANSIPDECEVEPLCLNPGNTCNDADDNGIPDDCVPLAIGELVRALLDPSDVEPSIWHAADVNRDGRVDGLDIAPYVSARLR